MVPIPKYLKYELFFDTCILILNGHLLIICQGIQVTDEATLQRLFTLLEESYPRYATGAYNIEIATLLDTVRDICSQTTKGK